MNKFLAFLAALVVFSNAHAQGEASEKFKTNATFRFRSEVKNKTDFTNNLNYSLLKARLDLLFTPDEKTKFLIQPQAAKTFGETTYVGNSTTTNTASITSGSTTDTSISVHQAWMEYSLSEKNSFKIGRQILSYGDELILGPLEWNNIGRTFDGLRFRMFNEGLMFFDLFTTKIQETNSSTSSSGDKDFNGFYFSYPIENILNAFDVYGFYSRNSTLTTTSELFTYGVRAKKSFESIDLRLEFTNQENESFGHQGNLELGYNFNDSVLTRLSAEYFTATKNFNQLYPTVHKWLGYADVFGRRNIAGIGVHSNFKISDELSMQLDAFHFDRVDSNTAPYKTDGSTVLGLGTASPEKNLGQEVDLTFKYKLSEASNLMAGYSHFSSGKYFENQFVDIDPSFYYVQIEARY